MPSADATFGNSSPVGNSAPTVPQTLLILLNLHITDHQDHGAWVETIESNALTFSWFLAIRPSTKLTQWQNEFTFEDLKAGVLSLANQVRITGVAKQKENNLHPALIARSLANLVDPELTRQAVLTCMLIDQNINMQDPEVGDALAYFNRPLPTLHGAPLLTRLVAVANHLASTTPVEPAQTELEDCAALLSLTTDQIRNLLPEAPETDTTGLMADDDVRFEQALDTTNLIESSIALARQTALATAIEALARGLFGARAISIFTENPDGWRAGDHLLESPRSIISLAASSGESVSTIDHVATVADEKVLASMGSTDGLAIPVFIDEDGAEVCIVVLLLAMNRESLAKNARQSIEQFQAVNRHLFTARLERGVDRETIDRRAREIIHEANNPISTVQNYLKVLSLKLGAEHEAQNTLESISSELLRAADIVRSFNNLKDSDHSPRSSDVNKIIRQIGLLFDQGNDFHVEYLLDDSNPVAQISNNDLKQILTNLIRNATECTPPDGTITLATAGGLRQGNTSYVEVVVRDTGPGIPEGIGNIFAQGVTTKTGDHMGEGLKVVQQLTLAANGVISYRSNQQGTEFRTTIPQVQQG